MAGTFNISTINVISPNGLVTKSLTVDDYGYAKIGDERVGVTPQNWIINGQFDVWQRGTSFTAGDGGYTADRWSVFQDGTGSSRTESRQLFALGQTDVPNNPLYFYRRQFTVAPTGQTYNLLRQNIEDVTKFSNKTVTLSFWAKADSARQFEISFGRNYGTGGSTTEYSIFPSNVTLSLAWQRFTKTVSLSSVSGKTVGANSYTMVNFVFPTNATFTFDIANVCLVEGSVPVECPNEPYAEVLRKCQRYYQRFNATWEYSLFNSLIVGSYSGGGDGIIPLSPPMRTAPSSVEYNGLYVYEAGVAYRSVSSIGLSALSSKETYMFGIAATGVVQSKTYMLAAVSNASYIALNAEL